jgi:hypothetical protein
MGKRQIQTKCILCGNVRPIGKIKWGNFSAANYFIQVRDMPGGKIPGTSKGYRGSAKGRGFKLVPEESLRLDDIKQNSEYFDEVQRLAAGARRIVNMLEKLGY